MKIETRSQERKRDQLNVQKLEEDNELNIRKTELKYKIIWNIQNTIDNRD